MFTWAELNTSTRVAVVSTAAMVFFLIIPPLALVCGLISLVSGGVGFRQASAADRPNPTAQWCMMISGVLLFLLIAGNILYSRS